MALQEAILAVLTHGESSGYDLTKAFRVTVANFWTATPQQIYRELGKMEAAGLIAAHIVEQSKRPNKRVFSLTNHGRAALRDFIARSPKPIAFRDELLVQVEAMEFGDVDAVKANVRNQLAASQAKLKHYEKYRERLLGGRSEATYLAEEAQLGSYLTLARGIAFEQENTGWCEFTLRALEGRATG